MSKKDVKKIIEGFENLEDIKIFEDEIKKRNEMIFYIWKISLNLALRVSDTLSITIEDAKRYISKGYYLAKDKKTGKANRIKLNKNTEDALIKALELRHSYDIIKDNPFLFVSNSNRSKNTLISMTRVQVFRVYKESAEWHNLPVAVGTHSARKTWGLQVYKATKDISIVQHRLNHTSQAVTLKYIGLTQKKMDSVAEEFNF